MQPEPERAVEDSPKPRLACTLLLDTSGPLGGEKIGELNAGLKMFSEELRKEEFVVRRVDLAIMTFDRVVTLVRDFSMLEEADVPTLTAQAPAPQTMVGTALQVALDQIRARKQFYKSDGTAYFRPELFILTDGHPKAQVSAAQDRAATYLLRVQKERRVWVFPVGIGEGVDVVRLAGITSQPRVLRFPYEAWGKEICRVLLQPSWFQPWQSRDVHNSRIALPDPCWFGWSSA